MAAGIEASQTTYSLGFYLPEGERDERFHVLSVAASRPGVQLTYRKGYYAGSAALPEGASEKGELSESVLLNQVDSHDVGITAQVDVAPGTPQGTVNIRMNLDTRTLSLTEKERGWTGRVNETFVELNEAGRTLARVSDTKEFEFPAVSRARFEGTGVTWPQSIPLAQGTTKLAIIVRDATTGRIGSLTIQVH